MSSKEFWEDEPNLLWAYRKSYMEKIKIEKEIDNVNAWLIGLYIYDGVNKALYNNFGRKESQPVLSYMEKPIDFNEKPKTQEEIERENILKVEEQIRERNKQIKEMLKNK